MPLAHGHDFVDEVDETRRGIVLAPVDHESMVSADFRCLQQSGGERNPNALTLPDIGDDQAHLRAVTIDGAQVAERDDVAAYSPRRNGRTHSFAR